MAKDLFVTPDICSWPATIVLPRDGKWGGGGGVWLRHLLTDRQFELNISRVYLPLHHWNTCPMHYGGMVHSHGLVAEQMQHLLRTINICNRGQWNCLTNNFLFIQGAFTIAMQCKD